MSRSSKLGKITCRIAAEPAAGVCTLHRFVAGSVDTAMVSTRRGPREERDALRRRRLLDVGLEIFGTVGYGRSAIEDICARARVGTHSFYAEFASKEDLLMAVYDRIIDRLAARLSEAQVQDPVELESYVARVVSAVVDETAADERAARVRLLEVVGVSIRLEIHRRGVLHRFAELIQADSARLHAAGIAERPLSPMMSIAVVGAANELFVDWVLSRRRPARRRLIEELTHLYVAVMR